MYKRIESECVKPGIQQNVFGAFYAEDGKPYKNYKHVDDDKRDVVIPMVLMQLRWDCSFGFPGGKVDPGESLIEALIREIDEEVNWDISQYDRSRIQIIGSYSNGKETSANHCYGIQVPYRELKRIRLCASSAVHLDAENQGNVLVPIIDYGAKGGFQTFRNNVFKATAQMELDELVIQKGWEV